MLCAENNLWGIESWPKLYPILITSSFMTAPRRHFFFAHFLRASPLPPSFNLPPFFFSDPSLPPAPPPPPPPYPSPFFACHHRDDKTLLSFLPSCPGLAPCCGWCRQRWRASACGRARTPMIHASEWSTPLLTVHSGILFRLT